MTYLLFAARKIQIKRQINDKNYELTLITDQWNEATKAVADKQQYMTDMKNMTSIYAQGFQSPIIQKALTDNGFAAGTDASSLSAEDSQKYQAIVQQAQSYASQAASAFTSVTNSIFEAANKQDLARLQAQSQSLEMRKEAVQTEADLLSKEYSKLEEARSQSAEAAAPKFGLV